MSNFDLKVDASFLTCPLPLLKTKQAMNQLQSGEVLYIVATDPNTWHDLNAFIEATGHKMVHAERSEKLVEFWIRKK